MAIGETSGCTAYNPVGGPLLYGYRPSFYAGLIFVAIFGTSLGAHIVQAKSRRPRWTIVFVVGALSEVLGWSARLWSSKCPYESHAFLMQHCTLILAPTFFAAGLYLILGGLIKQEGCESSPLPHRLYLWVFATSDFISILIQAVGGGLEGSAANAEPPGDPTPGRIALIVGIIFQLVSSTVFAILLGLFCFRVRSKLLSRKTKFLLSATTLSTLMIYMRLIYRTVELILGWTGYLAKHEPYFFVLEGTTMVICGGIFNFIHPHKYLRQSPGETTIINGEEHGVPVECVPATTEPKAVPRIRI
ncbi:putative RTA1 domain protein [Halenospora varia]|nr:putative RTA1 domain protein [Halenospora varia]